MTELLTPESRKPGIVIFAAILNFIAAASIALLALFCLAVVALGAVASFTKTIAEQVPQAAGVSQTVLSVFLILTFAVLSAFVAVYVYTGIGLLKAKKPAWYLQVVFSVLGLLAFPFGTVLYGVLLVMFFQARIRDYFHI